VKSEKETNDLQRVTRNEQRETSNAYNEQRGFLPK